VSEFWGAPPEHTVDVGSPWSGQLLAGGIDVDVATARFDWM
jgi:hypothetical protein